MSVRKRQANSLDSISSHLLQTQKMGTVLRAYQQMVTLETEDHHLLHIVQSQVGNGPRRIVLSPDSNEVLVTFYPGIQIELNPKTLYLQPSFELNLRDAVIWQMPVLEKMKLLRNDFLSYLYQVYASIDIKTSLANEHPIIQKRLNQFFIKPTLESILQILGLGSGSTPIGDDALCGYILSQRFLGQSPKLIHSLVAEHLSQTTPVSQEMLSDVYHGQYSQIFIDWLQQLIHHPRLGIDQPIRGLGGQSGKMILASFYHFTIQSLKEGTYEHLFAYSR